MADLRPEAFDTRIAPQLPLLFRAAWRLTGHRADAEDLVQDTCVLACENLKALGEADHPDRWLLRVLYHRFIDGTRRRKRSPVVSPRKDEELPLPATDEPGPEDLAVQTDQERALQQACDKLSDIQRALLSLRAEGYGLEEIETITGVGKDVLRARLHRARLSLARYLEQGAHVAATPIRIGSKS
jgi:RNA polymerase sigma-70 factor (ECF subfamily)